MTYITTIEIDEQETDIAIDFKMYFDEVEVQLVTDTATGNAICPELSDRVYQEMHEMWHDVMAERSRSWS